MAVSSNLCKFQSDREEEATIAKGSCHSSGRKTTMPVRTSLCIMSSSSNHHLEARNAVGATKKEANRSQVGLSQQGDERSEHALTFVEESELQTHAGLAQTLPVPPLQQSQSDTS